MEKLFKKLKKGNKTTKKTKRKINPYLLDRSLNKERELRQGDIVLLRDQPDVLCKHMQTKATL